MHLLGNISAHVDENRSTVPQIFCIRQTLESGQEYKRTANQLFTDFKKAFDSIRSEAQYNILIQLR
jgi:hypothetical protein